MTNPSSTTTAPTTRRSTRGKGTTSTRPAKAKKAASAPSRRRTRRVVTPPLAFTERLGIRGWSGLDPILLASLALEAPLLLVGAHGTAKTLIAERVATTLELELRHYNASLLNYDDLVGIPVPDDDGGLRYLGAAGAVWDAQFVFLDEINRCRPDLQNKLFPLVHERRIAGEDLTSLRHRWAAINPPGGVDEFDATYLGVEELDDALVDRFWFIVPVPDWATLERDDRLSLVRSGAEPADVVEPATTTTDEGTAATGLASLIERTVADLEAVDALHGDRLAEYVVSLVDELAKSSIVLSPRRARVLLRDICAVHAARLVLGGDREVALADSAELALLHALPQRASAAPPSIATVIAAHRQVWEVTELAHDDILRELLEEPDPIERVRRGVAAGVDERQLSRLVTAAIGSCATVAERHGLAFVFARFLAEHPLTPAAWGPIAELSRPLLTPGEIIHTLPTGLRLDLTREIEAHLATATSDTIVLETLYLRGVPLGELQAGGPWREQLERFCELCARFEVTA